MNEDIMIFNPQQIWNKKPSRKFDFFIIDECHVGLDEQRVMINSIIKHWCKDDCPSLLVTATPWDILEQERFKGIKVFKRSLESLT